jgi:hypothetical protein
VSATFKSAVPGLAFIAAAAAIIVSPVIVAKGYALL